MYVGVAPEPVEAVKEPGGIEVVIVGVGLYSI